MLCAICLETLVEIYPYSLREWMEMQMSDVETDWREIVIKDYEERHAAYLQNEFRMAMLERLPAAAHCNVDEDGEGL